jgi:hypothetical protein
MKNIFKTLILFIVCQLFDTTIKAQFSINAFPLKEIDSMYNHQLSKYELQYNVDRFYDKNCLDSMREYANAVNPTQRQYYTYPSGSTNQQPIGRSIDLRPRIILNQIYNASNWKNYNQIIDSKYTNHCQDSMSLGLQWNVNSWDTSTGRKWDATFLANGNPSHIIEKEYDPGTGIWYNYTDKYFYYNANNELQSIYYRLWATFSTTVYFDYIDSNFAFTNYTNYCNAKIDTVVTYKKSGAIYLPESRTIKQHLPFEGYVMEYATFTNNTWLNSMKYAMYYDSHANDSIYKKWNWNSTTQQYDIQNYYSYTNSYDASGNLISQETFKNLNSATPNVLYRSSKVVFSNFVNCSIATSIESQSTRDDVIIYPNPSNGSFNLELPASSFEHIQMFVKDITGKIVYQQFATTSKSRIHLQQPKGIYFLEIRKPTSTRTFKFIIQ